MVVNQPPLLRLQEELQTLTLQKSIANITSDITEMEKWSQMKQDIMNHEGHLDIKFLNSRFENGKKKVDAFSRGKHQYLESTALATVQPETLKFMSADGGSPTGYHGCATRSFVCEFKHNVFQVVRIVIEDHFWLVSCRTLLLIMDCSNWPGSDLIQSNIGQLVVANHSVCVLLKVIVHQGTELVEQALIAARALLNGNEHAALFVLGPLPTSTSKADRDACMKKRRIMEDRLSQTFGRSN